MTTMTSSEAVNPDAEAIAQRVAEIIRGIAGVFAPGPQGVSQTASGNGVLEAVGSFAPIDAEDVAWDATFAATTDEQTNALNQMATAAWASVDAGEAVALEEFIGLDEE